MTIEVPELHSPRQEPQIFSGTRAKPQPKKDPATEVGFFLRRERETRGISVESASEATGIHPYHIDAIEMGDLTHMPPRLEAMEMIAGYAQYLGFEPEPLIEHLATFLPAPPLVRPQFHPARPPILSSAKVLSFGKLPKVPPLNINLAKFPGGSGGIVASLAAAFAIIVGAHWMTSGHGQNGAANEQVAMAQSAKPAAAAGDDQVATASTSASADVKVTDQALPEGGQIANTAPAADDADAMGSFIQDQATEPAPAPKAAKPAKQASAAPKASTKIQDRIKPEEQMKVAAANPIPQPAEGRIYGAENKDARIVLKATAPVWLRIEDQQGVAVMTQMLNAGDMYRVPNRDGLIALSRDGGRLAFMIDGQEKGVLGPPGKILVSEKLDVAALEAKK